MKTTLVKEKFDYETKTNTVIKENLVKRGYLKHSTIPAFRLWAIKTKINYKSYTPESRTLLPSTTFLQNFRVFVQALKRPILKNLCSRQ